MPLLLVVSSLFPPLPLITWSMGEAIALLVLVLACRQHLPLDSLHAFDETKENRERTRPNVKSPFLPLLMLYIIIWIGTRVKQRPIDA